VKNEKGLTLVEVLAAITISSIVLGVAFMLMSATNQLSKNNNLEYVNDAEIRKTLDTVAKYVSESNLAYVTSANELRFITYASGTKEIKSLYYNPATRVLSLYNMNLQTLSDTASPTNSMVYTGQLVLSKGVSSLVLSRMTDGLPLSIGELSAGSAFTIGITFNQSQATTGGISAPVPVYKESSFKLLQY
jgi:prepilin-type N-terminal cleavage/methylation domain-containing protein